MRALLIGGGGFIGPHVVSVLHRLGHDVTVFHRGTTAVPPHAREIRGDRNSLDDPASELRAAAPDVVIDLVLSLGMQARQTMEMFRGFAQRIVALSSSDVHAWRGGRVSRSKR